MATARGGAVVRPPAHKTRRRFALWPRRSTGPPASASDPDADIDPAPRLQNVNNMLNHVCEPIRSRWDAFCGWGRGLQDAAATALTLQRHHILFSLYEA
jgi:hypothetical protein